MRAEVKVKVPRELHERLKEIVKEGRLRSAGVRSLSEAYELALRLLLEVAEGEGGRTR